MNYKTPYIAPTLTVDLVLFDVLDGALCVLLVRRANEPFRGEWALPGGYNPAGETTRQALKRIISTKTLIDIDTQVRFVEQLYSFDTTSRDPRGHAVSVTYMGAGFTAHQIIEGDHVKFFKVSELPPTAYDHAEIITYAHKRIAEKINYTNCAGAFLSDTFTLTELQQIYEAIVMQPIDKRNFRKRILGLDMINKTTQMRRIGASRPATLYTFNAAENTTL